MTEISRNEFIRLTVGTREKFDARARRQQFPFLNTDLDDVVLGRGGADSRYRAYRAIDALMTIVGDELSLKFGMPYNEASWLACQLYPLVRSQWPRICSSSASHAEEEILCAGARFVERDAHRQELWIPFCGALSEILQAVSLVGRIEALAVVSVTQAARLMRSRAEPTANLPEIDLAEFWNPQRFQPGAAE